MIYDQVIQASINDGESDDNKLLARFQEIVGSIVILFDVLSANTLSEILNIGINGIQAILKLLHSVLIIPDSPTAKIQLLRPSFRDFLLDEKRYNIRFLVNEASQHKAMAENCIRVMSVTSKRMSVA
jgi:hypothetical protein